VSGCKAQEYRLAQHLVLSTSVLEYLGPSRVQTIRAPHLAATLYPRSTRPPRELLVFLAQCCRSLPRCPTPLRPQSFPCEAWLRVKRPDDAGRYAAALRVAAGRGCWSASRCGRRRE